MPPEIVGSARWRLFRAKIAWPLLIVAILITTALTCVAFSSPVTYSQHPIKDVYDGNATLDKNGEATIELPTSVTTEHRSFTYQAKPIGTPMPNLFIKSELSNNSFVIAGGRPSGTISWQLVGTRNSP
jgi:hypothetical protein